MIGALIDHLWQSTLVCAVVWLITIALRNDAAALRHSLWLAASLKFLVPFSVLYQLGALAGLPAPVVAQPVAFSETLDLATPVVSPTHAVEVLGAAHGAWWITPLAVLWLAGAAVMALRWWVGWRQADSMARAARPVPGSSADVCVTDADIEPAVARVFHPVVLLPVALLRRLTPDQLRAVLAHEREHIARRDNLTTHLHRLVETLFWFHPLVWWIGGRLVEERERACDEAVLRDGHDAGTYAEGILAVCRHCHHLRLRGASSALSGDLTLRIRGIIRQSTPAAAGSFKILMLAAAALAVAATPLFAGAVDGTVRRIERIARDTLAFRSAQVFVSPAGVSPDGRNVLRTESRAIVVRNTSLRELVALSFGVSAASVRGGGDWLDAPRYDIRAELREPLTSPEDFEPVALRGAVIELLAARFDLQVHVNQHCQAPCGRRALLASIHSP